MLFGRNVPQFLDPQTENLWTAILPQLEDFGQPLGQVPARTFGEKGVACMQFHALLIVGSTTAVARDAHIPGRDALHRAVLVEQDLGGREARENLDPQLLRLARQPAAEIAETKRVGA